MCLSSLLNTLFTLSFTAHRFFIPDGHRWSQLRNLQTGRRMRVTSLIPLLCKIWLLFELIHHRACPSFLLNYRATSRGEWIWQEFSLPV